MTYSTDELAEIFKGLDVECRQCGGRGRVSLSCGQCVNVCDVCKGTGRQLTGAGVELLNFLERHRERVRGSVGRADIAKRGNR